MRTYGELDERARRLASVLAGRGAGPGRPVATVLPNGIEIFEVATAAAMLDAPYLPVNWHLRSDELAYILADADVAVVVGQAGYDDELTAALDRPGRRLPAVGVDYEDELAAAAPLPGGDSGGGPGAHVLHVGHHGPAQGRGARQPGRRQRSGPGHGGPGGPVELDRRTTST